MLIGLVKAGIGSVLQLPVSQKLASSALLRVVQIVRSHFQDSSHELAMAYRESLMQAMIAIASGLATESELSGMWNKLKKLGESRLSQEFSSQIQARYLQPFAQRYRYRLPAEALERFRKDSMVQCKQLARRNEDLLPLEMFAEPDWAAWTNETFSLEISELLVERICAVEKCEELLLEFLRHEGLLGDAVLHFFHERMRKNQRVGKTLAALQREGMWTDLRDLQVAQQEMSQHILGQLAETEAQIVRSQQVIAEAVQAKNFGQVAEWGKYLHELQQYTQAQQQRLSELPVVLQEAQAAWNAVGGRLDRFTADFGAWCGALSDRLDVVMESLEEIGATLVRVESGVMEIQAGVEVVDAKLVSLEQQVASQSAVLSELVQMMRGFHLGIKVKARDEFSTHNQSSLRVIQEAVRVVSALPRNDRGFSMAAIQVGSALSSSGNMDKSIEFLRMAQENAQNESETALASYNLFQVLVRQKQYPEALEHLKIAINLEKERYALHDVGAYPLKRILGAGGMGCVFLCENFLHGEVVVKSFWESLKGPLEQVFAEARTMAKIAGLYVPMPLFCGYADPQHQDRPYIVMEHIANAVDGETYLEQHDRMGREDALKVGIQVAKGLEVAHEAGIAHLDLKPANLLLRRIGGEIQVKIIDFGLSRMVKSLKQEADIVKSRSGKSVLMQEIFGTLDYAPPEQLGNERYGKAGPHSDLFSFGATLYRLMSGENPRIINPRRMREEPELFELISECMEQDPKQRPASATELVGRLEQIAQKGTQKKSESQSGTRKAAELLPSSKQPGLSAVEKARREWAEKRQAQFSALYQEALELAQQDAETAWQKLTEAETLAPDLCNPEEFREWRLFLEAEKIRQKTQKAEQQRQAAFHKLYQEAQELAQQDAETAWQQLIEAEKLAPELCGGNFGEWKIYIKSMVEEAEARKRQEEARRTIDRFRPEWLPERVARNASKVEIPGPEGGGCFVSLPELPRGIERKVILARDNTPLLEMVKIPAGEFTMGTDPKGPDPYVSDSWVKEREMPQKRIHLEEYWISRTPVTNRMWKKFLAESGYNPPQEDRDGDYLKHWSGQNPPGDKLEHPMVYVSPINAWAFCDFYGLMLPCEAQWEKAARGTDGRIYPWGNQEATKDLCNFYGAGIGTTTPVGQYPRGMSVYGLLDCAGNVWEWCADAWDSSWLQKITNENIVCKNRAKNDPGSCRGGSFFSFARNVRCACRRDLSPQLCLSYVGFRPAQGTGR